jgi:hypothetical protein
MCIKRAWRVISLIEANSGRHARLFQLNEYVWFIILQKINIKYIFYRVKKLINKKDMGRVEYTMSGLPEGFQIGQRHEGITQRMGKSAGIESNWYYDAIDSRNEECIIMFCRPEGYTILDKNVIPRIRENEQRLVTWFIMKNGYVAGHIMTDMGLKNVYLHQILMEYRGHGRGSDNIDHINRNKLDNRMENLRISTQSEQTANRGKLSRKHNARALPDGMTQTDLPKFVIYYKEKHGTGIREFFTVEKHPIQQLKERGVDDHRTQQLSNKRWATSKSKSIAIHDKLQQARDYVTFLDHLV